MKNVLLVVVGLIAVAAIGAAAYFYGKTQINPVATSNTPTASPSLEGSASPVPMEKGIVAGRLCYPASVLPPGKIVAKNINSAAIYSQDFVGSQAGGSSSYSFELPPGIYHLKYDATGPSGVLSGYYTSYSTCVGDPSGADCSGDKTRAALPVEVKANAIAKDINLCDFYYPAGAAPSF